MGGREGRGVWCLGACVCVSMCVCGGLCGTRTRVQEREAELRRAVRGCTGDAQRVPGFSAGASGRAGMLGRRARPRALRAGSLLHAWGQPLPALGGTIY